MALDPLSPAVRRWGMSRINNKSTKLEPAVRRMVFAAGYRYRIRAKDLERVRERILAFLECE